jgi:hypothetical protein
MEVTWWEGIMRFICGWWWLILLILVLFMVAFFTRDFWLPALLLMLAL